MFYFYLSFPRSWSEINIRVCENRLEYFFKLKSYERRTSYYNYKDLGYRLKTKEKFNKIRKYLKKYYPKIKICWTGKINLWN